MENDYLTCQPPIVLLDNDSMVHESKKHEQKQKTIILRADLPTVLLDNGFMVHDSKQTRIETEAIMVVRNSSVLAREWFHGFMSQTKHKQEITAMMQRQREE